MTNNMILAKLFLTYKDDNKERLAIYCEFLQNVSTDLLAKAAMKCITERRAMPSIADILAACESVKQTLEGKKIKDWDEAWDEIYKGWCEGGPYKPRPKWSTPEIERTVESFGWLGLLEAPAEQTMAIRAQMKVLYETVCRRQTETVKNSNILTGKTGFEQIGSQIKKITGGKENVKPSDTTGKIDQRPGMPGDGERQDHNKLYAGGSAEFQEQGWGI